MPMNNKKPIELTPVIQNGQAVYKVALAPTQVRRPWRSTARTIFQATVALAAMWAVIVQTLGLPDWAWVGTSVAVAGGITRLMAVPQVELFLRQFLPWLAAAPRPTPANSDELPNRYYGRGVTPARDQGGYGRVWPMLVLVAVCVIVAVFAIWL